VRVGDIVIDGSVRHRLDLLRDSWAWPAAKGERMAELTIRPEEVQAALASLVQEFKPRIEQEEVGRVIYSGDGIAIVSGLPRTMSNELLSFPGDLPGSP